MFDELNADQQAALKAALTEEYRNGSRVGSDGKVVLSDTRIKAIEAVAPYYITLYGNDLSMEKTREHFAMKNNTLPDETRRQRLTNFFFWTSWAAATNRPNHDATYTNNWPHEPLINNVPTTENVMWSVASIVFLLAGIGLLVWGWSFLHKHESESQLPDTDPISKVQLTPSQRALGKYVFLTVALFIVQILLGGSLRTTPWKASVSSAFRCLTGSPMRWCALGTCNPPSSGLPPASSLPACSWLRW